MIEILYLCNRFDTCSTSNNCGTICNHTSNPDFAANKETIKLVDEFTKKFYNPIVGQRVALFEGEKE